MRRLNVLRLRGMLCIIMYLFVYIDFNWLSTGVGNRQSGGMYGK